jgi:hypothetical protein
MLTILHQFANFANIDFMLTNLFIIYFEINKGICNASSAIREKSPNHSAIGRGKFNAVSRAHCGVLN